MENQRRRQHQRVRAKTCLQRKTIKKAPRLQLFLLVVRRCGGAVMQWCSASDLVAVA